MLIQDERCGCTYDDAVMDTTHYPGLGHYPLGGSPHTFCKRCDLWRPCVCGETTPEPVEREVLEEGTGRPRPRWPYRVVVAIRRYL